MMSNYNELFNDIYIMKFDEVHERVFPPQDRPPTPSRH